MNFTATDRMETMKSEKWNQKKKNGKPILWRDYLAPSVFQLNIYQNSVDFLPFIR